MADENTIDYPALCEELSARVTELEAALSEEQDKNAVLVQQVDPPIPISVRRPC